MKDDPNKLCKLSQSEWNILHFSFNVLTNHRLAIHRQPSVVVELCKNKRKLSDNLCEFVRKSYNLCSNVCILAMRKNGTRNFVTHVNILKVYKIKLIKPDYKLLDFNSLIIIDHINSMLWARSFVKMNESFHSWPIDICLWHLWIQFLTSRPEWMRIFQISFSLVSLNSQPQFHHHRIYSILQAMNMQFWLKNFDIVECHQHIKRF